MHRIKLPSGRRRRLTVREGARLQSFRTGTISAAPRAASSIRSAMRCPPCFPSHWHRV
jgi:site-specific DNA-cytosine methylase